MLDEELKTCSICKDVKLTVEFNKNKTKKDGLATFCKDCNKKASNRYYTLNKVKHKAAVYEQKKKNVQAMRQYVYDLSKAKGCIDCSETDPIVLDFDHVRGKKVLAIGNMVPQNCSFATLQEELAKCEIRCSNCHRRKTAKEQNWYASLNTEKKVRIHF